MYTLQKRERHFIKTTLLDSGELERSVKIPTRIGTTCNEAKRKSFFEDGFIDCNLNMYFLKIIILS